MLAVEWALISRMEYNNNLQVEVEQNIKTDDADDKSCIVLY